MPQITTAFAPDFVTTPTPVSHLHHRSRALTLHTRDALDALGSLWTCGALWSGLTLGAWVPTRRWRPPVSSRRSLRVDNGIAGLWRVTESP